MLSMQGESRVVSVEYHKKVLGCLIGHLTKQIMHRLASLGEVSAKPGLPSALPIVQANSCVLSGELYAKVIERDLETGLHMINP